jgi:hypothetical protein
MTCSVSEQGIKFEKAFKAGFSAVGYLQHGANMRFIIVAEVDFLGIKARWHVQWATAAPRIGGQPVGAGRRARIGRAAGHTRREHRARAASRPAGGKGRRQGRRNRRLAGEEGETGEAGRAPRGASGALAPTGRKQPNGTRTARGVGRGRD